MKKLLLSAGLLVASYCAWAQNSLVYKITGNGLDTPSYVMGTIHMICEEDYQWTPAMQTAFDKTSEVCLEINLSDQTTQMALGMAMMNQGGPKISEQFNEVEKKALIEKFNKLTGQSGDVIDMLKPIALVSILTPESFACKNDLKSYEAEIMMKAQASEKKLHGIESVETQIKAMSTMPDSAIFSMTRVFLNPNNNKETKKLYQEYLDQTATMVKFYKAQDVEGLYKFSTSSELFKMNEKVMLDDRNTDWIPKMTDMMKDKPMFFAFGAAHLGGDIGVINQLKKAGYTVTPVL